MVNDWWECTKQILRQLNFTWNPSHIRHLISPWRVFKKKISPKYLSRRDANIWRTKWRLGRICSRIPNLTFVKTFLKSVKRFKIPKIPRTAKKPKVAAMGATIYCLINQDHLESARNHIRSRMFHSKMLSTHLSLLSKVTKRKNRWETL